MNELDDDIPLTEEELAEARRGEAIVATAIAHPDARAPLALREGLQNARSARRPRRRLVAPALAAVSAALAIVLVVALGGQDQLAPTPSVQDVAAVTRLPARHGAPVAVGGAPARLDAAVEGLAFPDWRKAFGWMATGRRADRVGGRAVTTVYYRASDERRLGYAIVAGAPLPAAAGREIIYGGTRYRALTRSGRTTLTWTQAGHTCVIDAPASVAVATLVRLADWDTT
jgi:hypothetical protein